MALCRTWAGLNRSRFPDPQTNAASAAIAAKKGSIAMAGPQFFTPPKVAPSKSKKRFSLLEANKTLPLVSRIVSDIVAAHQAAASLQEKLETPQSARSHNNVEGELE